MNRRATTDGLIRDNSVYAVITRINGWSIDTSAHYYRRRTSFAGVFTGSYEEAQRLAKLHVNG